MGDLWKMKWRFEKFFCPQEVKIIEVMGVQSIFIDLYDFYNYEYGTEEQVRTHIRDAYNSILHSHDKFRIAERKGQ